MECETKFVVKQEIYEDEDITSQKENNEILPEPSAKCGEVFLGYGGGFTLVCAICSNHFRNLELFGHHIHDAHLNLNAGVDSSCDGELCVDMHNDPLCSSPATGNRIPEQEEKKKLSVSPENLLEQMQQDDYKQNEIITSINSTESAERKPIFTCGVCDCTYMHHRSYLAHARRAHGVVTKRMESKLSLQIREKATDNSKIAYSANDAVVRTTDDESTLNYLNRESEMNSMPEAEDLSKEEYKCVVCERKYKHKRSLRFHIRTDHRNQAPHTTLQREQDIPNRLDALAEDEHEQTSLESDQVHPCNICSRIYRRRAALRYHIKSEHGENAIPISVDETVCKYCDKEFNCKNVLEAHIQNDHHGDKKFVCPHCPKTFKCRTSRKWHINSHTGERPFKCPHCPRAFSGSSNLSVHIRIHLQIKSHCCSFCGKAFISTSERKRHERTHTGEKPHQCEECGKRYASSGKLTEHQKRHKNIKNYKCDVCSKTFYSSRTLKDHKMAHSSERPFNCNVCGQNFPRKRALRVHEQLHSDVKKYVCNTCGKAFAQCAGLYSHKKSHGEIK